MLGMEETMIRTATASFLGDAQIHRAGFRDEQEASMTIQALDAVTASLAKEIHRPALYTKSPCLRHDYVSSECQRD